MPGYSNTNAEFMVNKMSDMKMLGCFSIVGGFITAIGIIYSILHPPKPELRIKYYIGLDGQKTVFVLRREAKSEILSDKEVWSDSSLFYKQYQGKSKRDIEQILEKETKEPFDVQFFERCK